MIVVIGANPTDAHPVFASQHETAASPGRRTTDRHRSAPDRSGGDTAHEADYHLQLLPGTNVAIINALAHVIVTEGLVDEAFVRERCDSAHSSIGASSSPSRTTFAGGGGEDHRRPGRARSVPRRGFTRPAATAAIYYGLGVTEHSQGSTMVMAMANLAMATGNIGRPGVGVNPLRGQNNVQGSCDMGSFPHEFSGYRHVSDDATRATVRGCWGVHAGDEPGLRIPNMLDAAVDGTFKGLYIQGEDIAQSDPDTKHVDCGPRGDGMRGRPGPVPERDRELRPRVLAGLVVPGKGRNVHQCRAPHQLVRKVMPPLAGLGRLGDHDAARQGDRLSDALQPSVARSWTRSRA